MDCRHDRAAGAGLVFQLSLLIYAMYVLLGVLLLSRVFTRVWTDGIEARRFAPTKFWKSARASRSRSPRKTPGRLAIPWLLLEDSLPRDALTQSPHHIKAEGARLAVARLAPGETKVLSLPGPISHARLLSIGPLLVETGDVFGLHRRFA
jgi:hypothetical protein